MSKLSQPHFIDAEAARAYLEGIRWPNGPVCPHCGTVNKAYETKRAGKYRCAIPACRKDFTVRVGTVFESSHIALNKWLLAAYLLCSSKKGISSHQLMRTLDVTYKTAWFMTHRLREAMKTGGFAPIGGQGKVVEADETYHGKREVPVMSAQRKGRPFTKGGKSGGAQKRPIVALVERGGEARAMHMNHVTGKNVREFLVKNADRKSRLHTDESKIYPAVGEEFAKHETVNHSAKEYVRDDVTTNGVEGFFGIFKRGMTGIYQHCGEQHLQRYVDEFTFRYNTRVALGVNDEARMIRALAQIEGKRLTYRRINEADHA